MRLRRSIAAAVVVMSVLAASGAVAGVITSATGPVLVNGKSVVIEPGKPLTLAEGDVVETGDSRVVFASESGDRITIEKNSKVRADGVTEGVDFLFIEAGAAYGTLGDKTSLGAAAGWASAPSGETSKVFVEVPADRPGTEASFRAVEGSAWVRYHDYTAFLPERHTVTFAVDPARPDVLAFRTSQQNPGDVRIERSIGQGKLVAYVPKATVGRIRSDAGAQTRIENDITSLKTGKIRIETSYAGKPPQRAALGPGTYAVVDNSTGSIKASFTAVEFTILEQAISLTDEFATLSQSNFADVGVEGSGPGRR